jgi:hypothetical protein
LRILAVDKPPERQASASDVREYRISGKMGDSTSAASFACIALGPWGQRLLKHGKR